MSPRRRDAMLITLSVCLGMCLGTLVYAPQVWTALLGVGLVVSLVSVVLNRGGQDSSGR